ncbi:MAG: lysophospholipase [Lachnospiraceae bacterium]|jgi:pimeloyl-ACP methyl ester carboxylesterase|nr:lysophospholipase [Lachnospiraceae bacterium]
MNVAIQREGITLRGRMDRPEGEKCPTVIMFHGFAGNIGEADGDLFDILSKALLKVGIATVRFDFSGHGKSDGSFVEMDVLREIEDGIAILRYVRSLEFVTDISILGHSQGGVVGGMLAGLYEDVIHRLVLLAPAATLKDDALNGFCMGTTYDTEHIPDVVSLNDGMLSVGGQYYRIAKHLPIYEVTKSFKKPALVIHGMQDILVNPIAAKRYHEELHNCHLGLYPNLDHGIFGADQDKAMNQIITFLRG